MTSPIHPPCPVCDSRSTAPIAEPHRRFRIPVFRCENCTHAYSTPPGTAEESQSDKVFKTNKKRARFYLESVFPLLRFNAFLDIGVPSDCFLLNQMKEKWPETTLHAVDLFPAPVPESVTFHTDLKTVPPVDLATALHVLEHIPGASLREFTRLLFKTAEQVIVEVPFCDADQDIDRSSRQPHVQFFTRRSLQYLVSDDKTIRVHPMHGFSPSCRPALVAYRLAKKQALANGFTIG